ncbi:MAG: small multi-drug export protein [Clostridia bacterium]|nr:small multi-drug export protein [Clostridia bacterium]
MWEKALYVFLISILPIIELRGAVPVGAALGLPFYIYAPLAVLGNLLPVPFILLFIPKILDLLERVKLFRPLIQWIRKKANRGLVRMQKYDKKEKSGTTTSEEATPEVCACEETAPEAIMPEPTATAEVAHEAIVPEKKKQLSMGAFLGLLLFVLIPLPGTGAWTGSLVASLFDFPKKQSFLAVTLGVLGACVIMTLASEGVVSIFKIFL